MKKSVRISVLFLVMTLFALMTAGCALSSSNKGKRAIDESLSVFTEAPDTKNTEVIDSEAFASNENDVSSESIAENAAIEQSVVYDHNGITITVKGIDYYAFSGPAINFLFENNSPTSVTIQSRNVSVNGYMVDPIMSTDVAAGKKSNDSMTFLRSDLAEAGITTIADIEFSFHIFDDDSWDSIDDSDIIRIETSAAKGFQFTYDNSGNQVYNDNGIEIVVKGLSEESWMGTDVVIYICNTSNKNVTVQARDVSINGFMIDPVFSCDVISGKHAIDALSFFRSDLEENGIERIESMELSFHVFDTDSWSTVVDTKPITINFD